MLTDFPESQHGIRLGDRKLFPNQGYCVRGGITYALDVGRLVDVLKTGIWS